MCSAAATAHDISRGAVFKVVGITRAREAAKIVELKNELEKWDIWNAEMDSIS